MIFWLARVLQGCRGDFAIIFGFYFYLRILRAKKLMQSDMKMQDVMNLKNCLYACVQWINTRHYVRKHENARYYYE